MVHCHSIKQSIFMNCLILALPKDCLFQIIHYTEQNPDHVLFGLTCQFALKIYRAYYLCTYGELTVERCLVQRQYCSCVSPPFVVEVSLIIDVVKLYKITSFRWILNNCEIPPSFFNAILYQISVSHFVELDSIFYHFLHDKILPADLSINILTTTGENSMDWNFPIKSIAKNNFTNAAHYDVLRSRMMERFEFWSDPDCRKHATQVYLDYIMDSPINNYNMLGCMCKNSTNFTYDLYTRLYPEIDKLTLVIIGNLDNVSLDLRRMTRTIPENYIHRTNVLNSIVNVLDLLVSNKIGILIDILVWMIKNKIPIYCQQQILINVRRRIDLANDDIVIHIYQTWQPNYVRRIIKANHILDLKLGSEIDVLGKKYLSYCTHTSSNHPITVKLMIRFLELWHNLNFCAYLNPHDMLSCILKQQLVDTLTQNVEDNLIMIIQHALMYNINLDKNVVSSALDFIGYHEKYTKCRLIICTYAATIY